ncbi:MAG: hypothetical protein WC205_02665 [Opitutaceae bacterium]|jgi:hypothetical protein
MRRVHTQDGFALLITITLLAFLVLLLVSLASLTRVETQVAANSQQLSLARQNAVMSLSLALGRLQSLAGPDQRTTATADITTSGQNGTHAWTGTWGNSKTSDDYVSSPQLLGWLVSGNESGTFTADASASAFGQISAASTPTFTPADPVVLGTAVANGAMATDVQLKSLPARVLMGPGSVSATKDYVVAPLQNIQVAASTIPGLTGSTATTIGRYAWWVGDEGVKARINLTDPRAGTATTTAERFDRLLIAQRHGIELITTDGTTLFGTTLYNVEGSSSTATQFRADLAKAIDYPQLPLLTGFGTNTLTAALRLRRHDLTTVSRGVFSDQLRGGLRHDLTVLLDADPASWTGTLKVSLDNASATYSGARRIADFQSSRLYSASYSMNPSKGVDTRSPAAATWEQVRSFYHYAVTNAGTVNAVAQTDTQMAIAPIVTRWGVSFDVSAATDGSGGQLHIYPHVVLWNPYNVTLHGSYRVRVEFADKDDSTAKRIYFIRQFEADGVTPVTPPFPIYFQETIAPLTTGTGKYSDRTLEFTIDNVDIPAGQAHVFTPPADAAYQASGSNKLDTTQSPSVSGPAHGFTRAVAHTFTSSELHSSALVLANTSGGNGGTMSLHLLDTSGNRLQLIDGVGLVNSYTVDNNTGTATSITVPSYSPAIDWFRDFTAGTSAGNQIGFCFANSLQQTSPNYNWLAQCNQRAPSIGHTWFEWSSGFASTANWSAFTQKAQGQWPLDLVASNPARAYTGPSLAATNGASQAILFNLPRADAPILSLGQLQHAALTFTPAGQEPTYPFGNAYATPHIQQNRLLNPNGNTLAATNAGSEAHLTDVSYLLNRALWDRFFFSGTPDVSTASLQAKIAVEEPLPDARIKYLRQPAATDVRDFDRAAAHLLVDGAFNVNSTSVEAWTALFASLRNLPISPATGASASAVNGTPYVRTPYVPNGSSTVVASANRPDQWAGYRTLTDSQVRTLATAMVAEVKTRGPFLSLADFVNRRLTTFPDATGLSGTLQSVLDVGVSGLNTTILEMDRPSTSDPNPVPSTTVETWTVGSQTYYLQNIKAPRRNTPNTGRAKAALAPGFLSQGDILQALGPGLAARSDTFVIRAYGETVNPLLTSTDAGYITGRAWCEAVVQRMPDYVDSIGNTAEVQPITGSTVNLTTTNQRFGRRFEVVSFRWLSPNEI